MVDTITKDRLRLNKPGILTLTILSGLFILSLFLRLANLGYSDFICDETVALDYLRIHKTFYSFDFLVSQHKGPGQYIVGGLVYLLSGDLYNEFIYRLPSAVAGAVAVPIFYLFVFNSTKRRVTAVAAASLLAVNGFTVAFGRIYQYQSFNILFSALSLLFFSKLADKKADNSGILRYSLTGAVFWCISLLFHWDAVYVLPFIIYSLTRDVLLNRSLSVSQRVRIMVLTGFTLLIIIGPYVIPFIFHYLHSSGTQDYFNSRVDLSSPTVKSISLQIETILYKIRLYNPLLFISFITATAFGSLIRWRQSRMYYMWFILLSLTFLVIFTNTGTHIYNILIPLCIISGQGVAAMYDLIIRIKRIPLIISTTLYAILIIVILGLLYLQSYLVFVDARPEYLINDKVVLGIKIRGISENDRKFYRNYYYNNKIGFPFNRDWKRIGQILDEYESANGIPLRTTPLQTNEIDCHVTYYTNRDIERSGKRFVVGVKKPMSLVNDYKNFSGPDKKDSIETVKDTYGETLAKIYITRELKSGTRE